MGSEVGFEIEGVLVGFVDGAHVGMLELGDSVGFTQQLKKKKEKKLNQYLTRIVFNLLFLLSFKKKN